jgi:hypothetical protein
MPRGRKRKEDKTQAIILRKPENVDKDTVAISKDLGFNLMNGVDFVGWEPLQKKLFILVLQEIDWMKSNNDTTIAIDNKAAALQLGWKKSSETFRNVGTVMRREFDYMTKHSGLSIQNPRTGKWHTGNLIYDAYGDTLTTYVKLNPNFMVHLESLIETNSFAKTPYLALIGHDVTDFKSSFAEPLFMNLRYLWDDSNLEYKKVKFTTRELKTIFKMTIEDYMKKDSETGELTQFNRTAFETRALIPAIEDINKGETMKILPWSNGKFFNKEKLNGKIHYYVFKYKVFQKDEIVERRRKVLCQYNKRFSVAPMPNEEWLNKE